MILSSVNFCVRFGIRLVFLSSQKTLIATFFYLKTANWYSPVAWFWRQISFVKNGCEWFLLWQEIRLKAQIQNLVAESSGRFDLKLIRNQTAKLLMFIDHCFKDGWQRRSNFYVVFTMILAASTFVPGKLWISYVQYRFIRLLWVAVSNLRVMRSQTAKLLTFVMI